MLQQGIQDGPQPDEEERLRALHRSGLLQEEPDPEYNAIVQLAADMCESPIALLSLVDRDRLYFKAKVGMAGIVQAVRKGSFSEHAIQQDKLLVIEDAEEDVRFRDNPRVQSTLHIRFWAGTPLRTEEGLPIGVLCVIDHVPRRPTALQLRCLEQLGRQLETHFRLRLQLRQVQEQRELLNNILSHIPYSVFWKDREGAFLGCNDAMARQLGLASPQDIVGRTDHDFGIPSEQIQAFRQDDLEVMNSGKPKLNIEEPLSVPDGATRWLLTSKVPLRAPDGNVWSVLGIFADITEQRLQGNQLKEAHEKLERYASRLEILVHEARERNRRLMEASLDAVFVLDNMGCVLEVNALASKMLGLAEAQLIGQHFDSLAPESERLTLRRALGDLLTRGTMHLDDQGLRSAAGSRLAVQLIGSIQDDGDARRLLLIAHDLTEQRRLEQQGIQNDRLAAMGVLAAGIAHEINNPTAYVLSNLDFLRSWWERTEQHLASLPTLPAPLQTGLAEVRHSLADCIDGCSRIHDIVRGMRHLSHQGHADDLVVLDVHSLVDTVLHISQGELKQTARLEKEYAPDLPPILGNEGRLGQVFLNLIVNAVHAMRPGTPSDNTLRVRTGTDEGRVRIDISDTGHGIPPEALPHIFDPFFTTKPAGAGTGLGLSISHSIIQKMGGEIRVESRVGQGTTFSLLLPANDEP